jgi:hypothetical protein
MAKSPSSLGGATFVASQAKARVHLRVEELKKALVELQTTQANLPPDKRCDSRLEPLVINLNAAADALCEFLSEKI